jgi:hypothetical protein
MVAYQQELLLNAQMALTALVSTEAEPALIMAELILGFNTRGFIIWRFGTCGGRPSGGMGERPDGGDGFEGAVSPVAAAAGKAETALLIGFRFRNCSRSRAVGGVNQDDSGLPPTTRSPLNPLRYPPQLLKSPLYK